MKIIAIFKLIFNKISYSLRYLSLNFFSYFISLCLLAQKYTIFVFIFSFILYYVLCNTSPQLCMPNDWTPEDMTHDNTTAPKVNYANKPVTLNDPHSHNTYYYNVIPILLN